MARNPKQYQYVTVGLKRDSWALEQLNADAQQHHMSKQLGKLIALRLTEYYEQHAQDRRHAPVRSPVAPATGERTDRPRSHAHLDESQVVALSESAERNAEEALDYWGSLSGSGA